MTAVHGIAPTVSVVIPCFNVGRYLEGAVDSVLAQSGRGIEKGSIEVVVVDDASTEQETSDALERLKRRGESVVVLRHTTNSGVSAARNSGLAAVRGDWIAFLDADDYWLPGSLSARLAASAIHPSAGWVVADVARETMDGTRTTEGVFRDGSVAQGLLADAFRTGAPALLTDPLPTILEAMFVNTDTVLMRRELARRVGGFEEQLKIGEDDHYWIRAANVSPVVFLPETVAVYRIRPGSAYESSSSPGSGAASTRSLLRMPELSRHAQLLRRRLVGQLVSDVFHHRRRGERLRALGRTFSWLRLEPRNREAWKSLVLCAWGKPPKS